MIARFNAARGEGTWRWWTRRSAIGRRSRATEEKGKFTFADVEDEESNLERSRKYLVQVAARDCFG